MLRVNTKNCGDPGVNYLRHRAYTKDFRTRQERLHKERIKESVNTEI